VNEFLCRPTISPLRDTIACVRFFCKSLQFCDVFFQMRKLNDATLEPVPVIGQATLARLWGSGWGQDF
jgi:hypothetical protein